MKYKSLLLSPLGLIPIGLQPAGAADMPVKAKPVVADPTTWAGWYVGVNLGIDSERSGQSTYRPPVAGPGAASYCWANNCAFNQSQTATGVIGGAQLGYNFQTANWVYGLETDFDFSSANKTTSALYAGVAVGPYNNVNGVEELGTLRGRLGYAFDNFLIYATGGLAYANMRDAFQGGNAYSWSNTGWRTGYAAGGGLQYMLNRNLAIKGEALYYDLGHKDHLSTGNPFGVPSTMEITDHMTGVAARIGLDYLFH